MTNPRVTVTYDDTGVSLIVVAGGALPAPVALTPAALVALLAASGGAALEQALAEAARRPHSLPDALGALQSIRALLLRAVETHASDVMRLQRALEQAARECRALEDRLAAERTDEDLDLLCVDPAVIYDARVAPGAIVELGEKP